MRLAAWLFGLGVVLLAIAFFAATTYRCTSDLCPLSVIGMAFYAGIVLLALAFLRFVSALPPPRDPSETKASATEPPQEPGDEGR